MNAPRVAGGAVDLGHLLRIHAMITQTLSETTKIASAALATGYERLRAEIVQALTTPGTDHLVVELNRVFPETLDTRRRVDEVVAEARMYIGMLGGWVQGLIDEQLLEQRIVAEARAKAEVEARPPTGFAAT